MWSTLLLVFACLLNVETTPCRRLKLPDEDSQVCVCNARFCDEFDQSPESLLKDGTYLHYISTRAGRRLDLYSGSFVKNPFPRLRNRNPVVMRVDTSRKYQEILGFGGAMTDAAGLNIATLSKATQETLIKQYFGSKGIGYTFIRVPFAGTDFSTYNYTYDDTDNDLTLKYFSLKYEDFNYKIPYIKMAQRLSPKPIKLFSASWSAPEWMKESRNGTVGFSRLRNEFYQLYAQYLIRCLDEYKKNGLEFWGLSPQNEPFHGLEVYYNFNSMGWTPQEQRDWIASSLGPALHSSGYENLKLMILDDNRIFLPGWATIVLGDPRVRKYVSGIAVHWYFDFLDVGGQKLSDTHYEFPDKFLLYTESSVIPSFDTSSVNAKAVRLGNWERAENYTSNIIEDINHWVTGWVDWNMALDTEGGPNWANNRVESPIIINATADEFYKQPMFYALAHFSKFVPPGSRRIAYRISNDSVIECVSFLRRDNNVVIVLQNRNNTDVDVVVLLENRQSIVIPAPAHSIHSVLFKPPTNHGYRPGGHYRNPHY